MSEGWRDAARGSMSSSAYTKSMDRPTSISSEARLSHQKIEHPTPSRLRCVSRTDRRPNTPTDREHQRDDRTSYQGPWRLEFSRTVDRGATSRACAEEPDGASCSRPRSSGPRPDSPRLPGTRSSGRRDVCLLERDRCVDLPDRVRSSRQRTHSDARDRRTDGLHAIAT